MHGRRELNNEGKMGVAIFSDEIFMRRLPFLGDNYRIRRAIDFAFVTVFYGWILLTVAG